MIVNRIDKLLMECRKQTYQLKLPTLLQYGMLFEEGIPEWEYTEYKTWDYGVAPGRVYFIVTENRNSESQSIVTIRTFQFTNISIRISDKDSTITVSYDELLSTNFVIFWETLRDLYQVIVEKKR